MGGLGSLLAPSPEMLFRFGASGAIPVFRFDRWWTIFSAGWLHGGLLHIFFNVMWVRQLAPETAELYGPGRTVIIYTIVRCGRLRAQLRDGAACSRACRSSAAPGSRSARRPHLRPARRARLLRPPHGQLAHRRHRLAVRGRPVRLRPVHERRRQLRPCRRVRRAATPRRSCWIPPNASAWITCSARWRASSSRWPPSPHRSSPASGCSDEHGADANQAAGCRLR